MELQVRKYNDNDKNFVYSTMLRGLYFGSDFFKLIDSDTYFKNYQKILELLLPSCDISIACLKEDEDVIFAYQITKGSTIVFAYTKQEFRGTGLQNKLANDKVFTEVSHLTKSGDAIRRKKNLKFNPF